MESGKSGAFVVGGGEWGGIYGQWEPVSSGDGCGSWARVNDGAASTELMIL